MEYRRQGEKETMILYLPPFFFFLSSNTTGLFIFLAVLVEYEQIKDPSDICQRWSSFRNRSWLLSWLLSDEEREECLNSIIDEFIDSVYGDLEDMTQQGSGWSFKRIVHFDCRHIMSDPDNLIRYGYRFGCRIPFHPLLDKLFCRNVFDPDRYLRTGFDRANLCVPTSILIAMHIKLKYPITALRLRVDTIEDELRAVNFRSLLRPGQVGLAASSFSELEKLNSCPINPLLVALFPALSFFEGIAINKYVIRRRGECFRIFPVSLSTFSRCPRRFQVDLLVDSPDIRAPQANPSRPPGLDHCLVITNLIRLIAKFTPVAVNWNRYKHVCRTCLKIFPQLSGSTSLYQHYQLCSAQVRGSLGRRKSRNVLIHEPYKRNIFTGLTERNGLTFRRGELYKLLKPLSIGFLDFEAYNINISERPEADSVFAKAPNSAVTTQVPMAYALTHACLYEHIELPSYLRDVRVQFYDEAAGANIGDFYIGLLLALRRDLYRTSQFMRDVLSKDSPPPPSYRRSTSLRDYINSCRYCGLCGARFGSKRRSTVSGRFYITRPAFDHCHYSHFLTDGNRLRSVLCQASRVRRIKLTRRR